MFYIYLYFNSDLITSHISIIFDGNGINHINLTIWNLIKEPYNIEPNINCYGTAIIAASKCSKELVADTYPCCHV